MIRRGISRKIGSSVSSTMTSINLHGQKQVPATVVFHPDKPVVSELALNRFLPRDQKYTYEVNLECIYDTLNIKSSQVQESFQKFHEDLESIGGCESRPFVSAKWLHNQLQDPELSKNIQIVDATWVLKKGDSSPYDAYLLQHIPSAIFFDIDDIAEKDSVKPHRFPTDETFNAKCSKLGISNAKQTIIYDSSGFLGSARALYTFQMMGFTDSRILSGGLNAWKQHGFSLESGTQNQLITRVDGYSRNGTDIVKLPEIIDNIYDNEAILVDARSAGRFNGSEPEPREGYIPGHIPGSKNVPYNDIIRVCPKTNKVELKSFPELIAIFRDAGIPLTDPYVPIITTCGSGITASALYHAFKACGFKNVRIYDGSWAEYAAPQFNRPIATSNYKPKLPFREQFPSEVPQY